MKNGSDTEASPLERNVDVKVDGDSSCTDLWLVFDPRSPSGSARSVGVSVGSEVTIAFANAEAWTDGDHTIRLQRGTTVLDSAVVTVR